jgi:hypothetical protein
VIEYDVEVSGQLITGVETDPKRMEIIPVGTTVFVNFDEDFIQALPVE